jgi:hypothetical protein
MDEFPFWEEKKIQQQFLWDARVARRSRRGDQIIFENYSLGASLEKGVVPRRKKKGLRGLPERNVLPV